MTVEDIGFAGRANLDATAVPLSRFIDKATALWRADSINKPDVVNLDVLHGAKAIEPIWEWENPPHDLDIASNGSTWLASPTYNSSSTHALTTSVCTGKQAAWLRIRRSRSSYVAHAAPMLYGRYDDATGRKLHRAVSGLTALTGNCAYDSGQQGLAQGTSTKRCDSRSHLAIASLGATSLP